MKLKNELYSVERREPVGPCEADYAVRLNPQSVICRAHFPGMPVMPGVCVLQMARELLEDFLGQRLEIARVGNAKFLSPIRPGLDMRVVCSFSGVTRVGNEVSARVVVIGAEEGAEFGTNRTKAKISFICKTDD